MKLFAVLFCLSQLTTNVAASVAAGKYQWVLLWYSYRMNVDAWIQSGGEFPLLIAPNCMGSGRDGIPSCNLDEFLEQTWDSSENRGATKTRTGITTVDTTGMTVDALADAIFNSGYGGAWVDPHKLRPDLFTEDTQRGYRFDDIFNPVIDVVQRIRQQRGDSSVEKELEASRLAIKRAIEGRIDENNGALRRALGEVLERAGFEVVYRPGTMVVDIEATKATDPENGRRWDRVVKDYVMGNWPQNDASNLRTHLIIVSNAQYIEQRCSILFPAVLHSCS